MNLKKKKQRNRQESISGQITLMTILIVVGTIFLCWLLNNVFLGFVYLKYKQKRMASAYDTLYDATQNDQTYTQDFLLKMEKICSSDNISMLVISSDGSVVISSQDKNDMMLQQLYSMLFESGAGANDRILSRKDTYTIESRTDSRLNEQYLFLWGTLEDGNLVLMRSNIESMQENANISNRFLLFVGIIGSVIGVIVSAVLSKKLTQPLRKLTDLSGRMTDLDFEARYQPGRRRNEIDQLGIRMNEMSDALERTMAELKQANADLQHDLTIRDKNESMRREFLSNVSHELKTPIALIQGYAEGLAEGVGTDPDSTQYYCEVIMDEAKKMNRLVQEMLTLNKIEYGKDNFTIERFDLTAVIRGVLSVQQLPLLQGNIKVIFDDAKEIFVRSDELLTEQIITNYLTNAIHYAKDERIIRITAQERENVVRFAVFNTGDPIPEESVPHLFEKFYKVDKARTREYGGSGIGLSVVAAICDLFHKEYGVINYNNGVEFWAEIDR